MKKGSTENEMSGWYRQISGNEFQHTLEISGGQKSLAYYIRSMESQRVGPDLATE